MKNCEYCSYYKSAGEAGMAEKKEHAVCTFTDTIFRLEDLTEREYLCEGVSYQEYSGRQHVLESTPKEKIPGMEFRYRIAQPLKKQVRAS